MWTGKATRLHPKLGNWYFATITTACLSAATLAIAEWERLWYFLPFAVGTYALAVAGYVAAKRRRGRWLVVHVVGVSSSYCGLVMAFLVDNARVVPFLARVPFFVRLAPLMLLSTCMVIWTGLQVVRGKLPKTCKAAEVT